MVSEMSVTRINVRAADEEASFDIVAARRVCASMAFDTPDCAGPTAVGEAAMAKRPPRGPPPRAI